MKLLTIDIEVAPNLGHVWGLFDQTISLSQLMESAYMLCFAAKWYGQDKVMFYSEHHNGRAAMVEAAHELLEEADALITYNGKRYDVPHLNREFIQAGLMPPSPSVQIDLLPAIRRQFRFPSNKLDYVAQALGLGGKVKHTGHQLWVDVMSGDEQAWKLMRKYCIGDVKLTEELYTHLLPWIKHPSRELYDDRPGCPTCGAEDSVTKRGYSYTQLAKMQRYQCTACGSWFRSGKAEMRVDVRPA